MTAPTGMVLGGVRRAQERFLGLGEYIGSGWVRRVALVPVDARGQVGQRAVTAQEPM